MDEREELEQVPWQQLLAEAEPEDRRRRAAYLGAGALGAVIVGMLLARMMWGPAPPSPPVLPEGDSPEEAVVADAGDFELPELPGLPLYSEADLMAFPADAGERAAVARAEWFVTDYFTADLEPNGSSDVRAALPAGALASYPQDATDGISYVEWARAFRVEAVGDGSYRVGVAFRTLAAPPDRGFIRQPTRAVEVIVAVRPDGGSAVVDVPAPIPLPAGPEPAEPPPAVPDPPHDVVEAAIAAASAWGSEARVVSAHRTALHWRVVVTVADQAGIRWPLAVRVGGG